MVFTKEQIRGILVDIQNHKDGASIISQLEDSFLEEMELNMSSLIEAYIEGNVEKMISAMTGWSMESLLAKTGIIPDVKGYFPSREQSDIVFPFVVPGLYAASDSSKGGGIK